MGKILPKTVTSKPKTVKIPDLVTDCCKPVPLSYLEAMRILWFEKLNAILQITNESQRDVAQWVGVTDNRVSRWCSGSVSPKVQELIRLADRWGLTVDQLVRPEVDLPDEFVLRYKVARGAVDAAVERSRQSRRQQQRSQRKAKRG